MRRSEAQRYARWAAGAAVALSLTVTGVYVRRSYLARQEIKKAPPIVPPTVEKRSETFSLSKVEGERTLFTVRASQATEFKEGGKSQLQDVWITIYGRTAKRFDNIHTSQCDYIVTSGQIRCAGEVQMDLESAEEASQRPGQRVIHVGTRNISFDRDTGNVRTDDAVVFRFPYGSGVGKGATYNTRDAVFQIHNDVALTLVSRGPGGKASEPMQLTGASLAYHRNDSILRLRGPVQARQAARELVAGELALELDADLRARKMIATGKPRFVSSNGGAGQKPSPAPAMEIASVTADEFITMFDRGGWVEKINAEGHVRGSRRGGGAEEQFNSDRAEIEMTAGGNQPKTLLARGNVKLNSMAMGKPGQTAGKASRKLETAALRIEFAPGTTRAVERRIQHAQSLAPATAEWMSGEESTRIWSTELGAEFGRESRIQALRGRSGVEIERRVGQELPQNTTARELDMTFDNSGTWSAADLRGNVKYREGDRTAEGQRAIMNRATQRIELTGPAMAADSITRTVAQSLVIHQGTGEIRGDGAVHTSYLARERHGIADLAPQPAHITADHLVADREKGRAVYSTRARMWQGDSVIEAAEIELIRDEQRLNARGGVMALFPDSAGSAPPKDGPGQEAGGSSPTTTKGNGQANLWRVRGATLTYLSRDGLAKVEESVSAQSSQGSLKSKRLDVFLSPASQGPRQLTRAVATGGASVLQGDLKGSAERADYESAERKFVLSGGTPTLIDPARGATTGRKLTFFIADDRILVDSEEGTRTLTRHRVEK